ncbi:hypothetical protein [Planococcus donghaensis]|uniref:Uncharacterized protein n=1 Tax=Planococcus donghaensis TaxID=414778 RepID=A0A1C7EHQ9_9BACL|nr:hypothetical protein [Planococcus donghaensis]ANU23196.1 hypothetical protein BCM40_07370 [Planococcus donghaensis]
MVKVDLLEKTPQKVSELLGGEMEFYDGFWHLEKKREVKAHRRSRLCVCWSLDLLVAYQMTADDQKAINQAEIFLLPEELSVFIGELIKHPNFLPISYSQQLSTERGMYCLRISSLELPEHFAERLSDSLQALGEKSILSKGE